VAATASDAVVTAAAAAAALVQELFQRGILATFATGWLLDRAFEAGIDDDILFYGQVFYLPDVVRCVVQQGLRGRRPRIAR